MTSNWVALWFPPCTSRTLSIALTDGHNSLFLRHPAIDTVWRWPCLPCLGCYDPLHSWCAWWSFSPGWCLNLSLQRMYVMTFLTLTHDLTVLQHSSWVLTLASNPKGEYVLLCVTVPSYASACLILHHIPPSMLMVRIVLCKCSGNRIIGYVIFN